MRIVVTGLIAQHPSLGGMTWHYLHYLIGLARLGHDVYYLEDSGEWPYLLDGITRHDSINWEGQHNIEYLERTLARFGFKDRWAYHFPVRNRWYGLSGPKRRDVLASANLLLNVSGSLRRPWKYHEVPRLVYIDTDPTFTQVRLQMKRGFLKFQRRVAAHDVYLTFGEALEQFPNPTPYAWIPTRQPVVLDEWATSAPSGDAFTTVMSWTSFKPLAFARRTYGQKDLEFQACLDLPKRVAPVKMEIAFSRTQHENWKSRHGASRDDLGRHGWRTVEATRACADLDSYRHYIQASKAEWSVAKNGYVVGQPGWFSDRSACYLAAGRPVVVQETGFGKIMPVGEGVLSFRTPDEAAAGVLEVEANYARHAKAAREIAHEFFDSDRVLKDLLDKVSAARANPNARAIVTGVAMDLYTLPQPFSILQFPGRDAAVRSYNPSLAWHDGKLVMAFRVSTMTRCGGRAVDFERHYSGELPPMLNAIGIAVLDPATMAVRDARVLEVEMPHACPWNLGYEDPRVFSFGGRLFILASRRNDRCYFALSIIELDDTLAARRVFAVAPDFDIWLHQKNWNSFVWEGRLFFVTSIAPHRIVEIDMVSGRASRVHESPSPAFDAFAPAREIRGGAGYIMAADRYLGICRTALTGETNRNDYTCVAYTFEAGPPFRVTGRSAPFILGAVASPGSPLQMATGLAEAGDDYLIAFGEEDCDMKIARVGQERLLASIEPG